MSHEPKLVELLTVRLFMAQDETTDERWARRALRIGEELRHEGDCTNVPMTCQLCVRDEYARMAQAVLDAINASGTHWVAPWLPDDVMVQRALPHAVSLDEIGNIWEEMRDEALSRLDQ